MNAGARHRVAFVLLALSALAVPFAARVPIDNRIELWIDPHGAAARDYARFRETFGSDEIAILAYEAPDVLAPEALAPQLAALDRLRKLPHVRRVSGVPAVYRELFDGMAAPPLRHEMLDTPYYRDFLVSDDARMAGLVIETDPPPTPAGRRDLVRGIEDAAEPLVRAGWATHLVGPPVLNAVLDETSAREAARSFPIAVALSIAVLLVLFRDWRAPLVAVACAALAIALTFGALGASGRSLNMVTSVLPSLLWVLALSGMVHVLERYRVERVRLSPAEAAEAALADTARPCTLAALTTALGFLSLLTADMRPVRELGAFAAFGMLASLAVNLSVGPLLAGWLRVPGRVPRPGGLAGGLARMAGLGTRRPWLVLGVSLAALVATGISIARIDVESDPLSFLPASSPTRRAYETVAAHLTGFYSLEMAIETPGGWLKPAVWSELSRIQRTLESESGVARVLSPLDLLRKLNYQAHGGRDPAWYRLPENAAVARALLARFRDRAGSDATELVRDDQGAVRLSALVRVMPSNLFLDIAHTARRALDALPAPLSGYATGLVLQLVDAQLDLVSSQLRSFGFAFATVFCCIALGLRSLRLTAVSVLPNVLPLLAAFAVMAVAGIALDAATVMVAGVALGIAVDDTVHVLSTYRREREGGVESGAAARSAVEHVGPAMLTTSLAACIGFFSLAGSGFVPIRWFGLLSGTAMAVALLADVMLVPALLALPIGRVLPRRLGRPAGSRAAR